MQVGFVGVGGIAGNYRASLKRLGVPVVAVHDANTAQAEAVAAEEGARVCRDHRELLETGVDAVFVCIPPFAHQGQVVDVAEAGKAVFVAKPVALRLEEARTALAAIQRNHVVNQSGYMWRSADCVRHAAELVGDRKLSLALGQVMVDVPGTPWWRQRALGGGQVLEQSTHIVDLMRRFLGDPWVVSAIGHSGAQPGLVDFEDSTLCSFKFPAGRIGTLASTNTGGIGRYSLALVGAGLFLELDGGANTVRGQIDGRPIDVRGEENGYYRQIETFLQAVEQGDPSLVPTDYADAARSLAATVAVNESLAHEGLPTRIEEVG